MINSIDAPMADDIGTAFNVGGEAFSSAGRESNRSLMASTSSACLNTEAERERLLLLWPQKNSNNKNAEAQEVHTRQHKEAALLKLQSQTAAHTAKVTVLNC